MLALLTAVSVEAQKSGPGFTSAAVADHPELLVGSRLKLPRHIKAKYDVSHIGERGVGRGLNFYSIERERALGKQLAQEIEAHSKLITDPEVNEYVNRLGQNIVHNSDAQVPFVIKVIDDDDVNAFALPGGYFYVNSGLILAAENEAELAGVMAHEIAHVAARHATRNETRSELWNIASVPLIFAGGPAVLAVRQVAQLAVPLSVLKFGRDAEREADLLGIEYSYATGYDPAAFVQFFERLSAREKSRPGFLAKAFSTHPMNQDRVRRAQDEIQTMLPARDQYTVNTSEFDTVKGRLAALLNVGSAANPNAPVLHRRGAEKSGEDDGHPTLKRREDVSESPKTDEKPTLDPNRKDMLDVPRDAPIADGLEFP